MIKKVDNPFYNFIMKQLNINDYDNIDNEYNINIGDLYLNVDLAIKTKDDLILVEVQPRITEDTIYRMYSLSHLIAKKSIGKRKLIPVCAGKSMKYSTKQLSEKLGVDIIIIPPGIYQYFSLTKGKVSFNTNNVTLKSKILDNDQSNRFEHIRTVPLRITSIKAWKVICSLLEKENINILHTSRHSGVSYGWTNNIIHKLDNVGIITYDHGINIKDIDKLLNAISWERSMNSMLIKKINTDFPNAFECMKEISVNFDKSGIDYAFTSYSSAPYYGSSIIRDDNVYMYLSSISNIDILELYENTNLRLKSSSTKKGINLYKSKGNKNCTINVYLPDRDVMNNTKTINNMRMVNICQNILDLAGMGIGGHIPAKELVNKIGIS